MVLGPVVGQLDVEGGREVLLRLPRLRPSLAVGLVAGNVIKPGASLHLTPSIAKSGQKALGTEPATATDFLLGLIPRTLFSSVTEGPVLQTLIVALLVGFALQMMGRQGEPILMGIRHLERLVFRVMAMVMWVARSAPSERSPRSRDRRGSMP